MLTQEQVDTIIQCIKRGQDATFDFRDATLCDAITEIIWHLESERMESVLFGLPMIEGHSQIAMYDTPEEGQRAFVHHAMHWAFQLGVGAALHAVGKDLSGSESPGEDPLD